MDLANLRRLRLLFEDFPKFHNLVLLGRTSLLAGRDGRIRSLDPETMDVLETVPALDGVAHALAVAPDDRVLVGGEGVLLKRVALVR